MAKKVESKKKQLVSGTTLKSDRSKVDAQERLARLQEEEALRARQKEERKVLEQQVSC